jgi:hypothetical protein
VSQRLTIVSIQKGSRTKGYTTGFAFELGVPRIVVLRPAGQGASGYRNCTREDVASCAPRQMLPYSRTQCHKLYKMDDSEISCSDGLRHLRRLVGHYRCCRLLGDELISRACLVSTNVSDEHEVRAHSLYRSVIREPDITTRAFRVHGSITVVLLQCIGSGVCPVADAA